MRCSTAAAVAAGHHELLEFTYRSFSLNFAGQSSLVPIDLTALQPQGDAVAVRVETPRTLAVDGAAGTLLVTPGEPRTLVVAQDRRTVAVSMSDAVFTGTDQIVAVAALALTKVH